MEKNTTQHLLPSIVIGASLIISSYLLSSGIREYGKSMERASAQPSQVSIPNDITLSFESGNSPVRFQQVD
jgi:hypothetical protein